MFISTNYIQVSWKNVLNNRIKYSRNALLSLALFSAASLPAAAQSQINKSNQVRTEVIGGQNKVNPAPFTILTMGIGAILGSAAFVEQNENKNIKKYKTAANLDNYKEFLKWLQNSCKEWNINEDLVHKIDTCTDEIFANIASYAYPDKTGIFEAELKNTNDNIILEIQDDGIEYNPLDQPEPDINLTAEERKIGGLGILMMKNYSDVQHYERKNNRNVLTLTFNKNNQSDSL